jgi:hypothetical protein
MQPPSVPRILHGHSDKLVMMAQAGPADAGLSLMVLRFLPIQTTLIRKE